VIHSLLPRNNKDRFLKKLFHLQTGIHREFDSFLLRRLTKTPVSRSFGLDRGKPIDRYYIEKFIFQNRSSIRGTVVEVGDSRYATMFGSKNGIEIKTLHVNPDSGADIICDLSSSSPMPCGIADCFIMTQTLPFIYDIKAALRNAAKILKPDGVLLITVTGICHISRYDMDRWGQYWSFTDRSLKMLLSEVFSPGNVVVTTFGNVKTASCFLYGLTAQNLDQRSLDYRDDQYQMLICGAARK